MLSTRHEIKEIGLFRLTIKKVVLSIGLLLPAMVNAEYVAQRLLCVDGPDSRVVEVLYKDQYSTLPCTIREKKSGQPATVLWRAQNTINFCVDQVGLYKEKLWAAGLQCEWLSGTDNLLPLDSLQDQQIPSVNSGGPAAATMAQTVSWTTIVTNGESSASQPAALQDESEVYGSQVIDLSSVTRGELTASWPMTQVNGGAELARESKFPLLSSPENVFFDPDISLDGWVIQVSARTLASIEKLLVNEPSKFEEYLLYEKQNSQTIYSKLQLRIDELAEIANPQKVTRAGAVSAQ